MKMALKQVGFKSLVLSLCMIWLSLASASAQTSTNEIVLYGSTAAVKAGNWTVVTDSTAAGGARISNSDAGAAKLANALASPTTYFEMTFNADANKNYRLWIRGKAESNSPYNDSFFTQFSGSVDSNGTAQYRIGTTSATTINIEDDSGVGLSGWGWQDNGWGRGVMGPVIRFATSGTQTIRIQPREDGVSIDQIVLSAQTYLNSSPGALQNDSTILPIASSSSDTVIWAADISTMAGNWTRVFDSSAAGGYAMRNPDNGGSKLANPLASPASYFEVNFNAESGKAYRLWIRGKAANNDPYNDSVFVQFSGSVTSSGSAQFRIGTTSGTTINLEDDSGVGLSGWGWQDNGWGRGVMGPVIYFASTGTQTIRVQTREDGLSIDQIVLSSQTYLGTSPGSLMNDSVILPSTLGGSSPPPPNQVPQVNISASILSGLAPLGINFSSNASDPDGYIAGYSWNFGDGQTSTQVAPWYSYSTAGTYTARLTVTDNAGATASASVVINVTSPAPPPSGGVQFKVVSWNMSMGTGTDYAYNLTRTAQTIANQTPDVVFLCEALRGDDDQAQILRDKLIQLTGVTWYFYWSEKFPGCTEGNIILSKWPFVSTSKLMMSYDRSVGRATININGKTVHFFATHLDHESSFRRGVEVSELTNFMAGFSGPRIVGGDFNAGPDTSEVSGMYSGYYDSWNEAMNAGTATAYPDNPVQWMTRTRRGRIDYLWHSRSASNLSLIYMKIPDLRDLSRPASLYLGTSDDWGVRPSDHNLVVAKYEVR